MLKKRNNYELKFTLKIQEYFCAVTVSGGMLLNQQHRLAACCKTSKDYIKKISMTVLRMYDIGDHNKFQDLPHNHWLRIQLTCEICDTKLSLPSSVQAVMMVL